MTNIEYIKHISFFSGLGEEDLKKIAEVSREKKYKKNTVIFTEGEPGEALYYIKSGKIKVYRTYEDGKEHIIHILGEGEVFGEVTMFNDICYPASASAYEDSVIGVIKSRDMEKLVVKILTWLSIS